MSAYADGETDHLRSHSIERHLRACSQCAETHRNLLARGSGMDWLALSDVNADLLAAFVSKLGQR